MGRKPRPAIARGQNAKRHGARHETLSEMRSRNAFKRPAPVRTDMNELRYPKSCSTTLMFAWRRDLRLFASRESFELASRLTASASLTLREGRDLTCGPQVSSQCVRFFGKNRHDICLIKKIVEGRNRYRCMVRSGLLHSGIS